MAKSIVFLGAGASVPFGIPTMTEMVEEFEANLKTNCSPYLLLFNDIKSRLMNYRGFDIEVLITVLEGIIDFDRMARILNHPCVHYFSAWAMNFEKMVQLKREDALRNREQAEQLLREVKTFIADCCAIKKESLEESLEVYDEFFHQIIWREHGRNFRQTLRGKGPHRVESLVFTTNYDQVLEAYCRRRALEYECGQAQNELLNIGRDSRLYSDVPAFHIFHLHGSINWYIDQDQHMRWMTGPAQLGETTLTGDHVVKELLVYPVAGKYTFREPFYKMFHYLKQQLLECNQCYVVGYSFRDEDILGIFQDALSLSERLHLTLIDPKASSIAQSKFPDFFPARTRTIDMEFSVEAARNIA